MKPKPLIFNRYVAAWIFFSYTLVACSKTPPNTTIESDVTSKENILLTAYFLEDTEVRNIHSKFLGRDYQLFVSLPPSYKQQTNHYFPVLFITDANYAFPLVRSIARRVGDRGKGFEDFILVGLSYAKGDTPEYSRRRDYTPTVNGTKDDKKPVSDMPGRIPIFGQSERFQQFIDKEIFPFIAHNYRVDMKRKIYAGHSFGGLLGIDILLTKPKMFEYYILGSPSLWFDQRVMFAKEKTYAQVHRDMPARVFMGIGSYETIDPNAKSGRVDARYYKNTDMIKDMQEFERALKIRQYPNLDIQTNIIHDEDHLSVFPMVITRGLKWALSKNNNALNKQ